MTQSGVGSMGVTIFPPSPGTLDTNGCGRAFIPLGVPGARDPCGPVYDMRRLEYMFMALVFVTAGAIIASSYFQGPSLRSVSAIEASSLGVYWDPGLLEPADSIDWGMLRPGEAKNVTVYIVNETPRPVNLTLGTTGWDPPEASGEIGLAWSHEGRLMLPRGVAETDLSLSVSPGILGVETFSFTIILTAEGLASLTIAIFHDAFTDTSVRIIYPSESESKPLGATAASVSDWLASSLFYATLGNAAEGLDIDPAYVDQATGDPVGEPGEAIVSFGGPIVNPVVRRAETPLGPLEDRAPIRFHMEGETLSFRERDGTAIPGASLRLVEVSRGMDLFVIETYSDSEGRHLLLCYGLGWKGTYAAGKYYFKEIHGDPASYPYVWMVVLWEDLNGDGFVNAPGDGDGYTVIATGP